VFVDALRYPLADRTRLDGTAKCLARSRAGAASVCSTPLLRLGATWLLAPSLLCSRFVASSPEAGSPLATTDTVRRRSAPASLPSASSLAITVVAAGCRRRERDGSDALGGVTLATLATAALHVTVVCGYLFPAAAVVSVRDGLRAGLRRDALRGTASSTYFLAWVGATVLVVVAWSALAATVTSPRSSCLGGRLRPTSPPRRHRRERRSNWLLVTATRENGKIETVPDPVRRG